MAHLLHRLLVAVLVGAALQCPVPTDLEALRAGHQLTAPLQFPDPLEYTCPRCTGGADAQHLAQPLPAQPWL